MGWRRTIRSEFRLTKRIPARETPSRKTPNRKKLLEYPKLDPRWQTHRDLEVRLHGLPRRLGRLPDSTLRPRHHSPRKIVALGAHRRLPYRRTIDSRPSSRIKEASDPDDPKSNPKFRSRVRRTTKISTPTETVSSTSYAHGSKTTPAYQLPQPNPHRHARR